MARNSRRGVEKSIAEFGTTWRIAMFAAFERVAQSFDQDRDRFGSRFGSIPDPVQWIEERNYIIIHI